MNNLRFQFGSNTPIGDQEKVIIKKLQAKVNEVLNNEGDKAYDEHANLVISIPLCELLEQPVRYNKVESFVNVMSRIKCCFETIDGDGILKDEYRFLFSSIDYPTNLRKNNPRKDFKFEINRYVVEEILQSSSFESFVNLTCE